MRRNGLTAIGLSAGLCLYALSPASAYAQNNLKQDFELYGSLRMQANYVSVDDAFDGGDSQFLGLSDAYSRLGARTSFGNDAIKITARYEVNINSADLDFGDPSFFDDQDSRLYSIKAEGKFGTLLAGKDWLPYYNNVGYPVDYFSSIYAGYTTYAYFREPQITYMTPTVAGVSGTLSRMKRTGGGASGWHYALSFAKDGFTLAAGREDMDGVEGDTQGAAVSYSSGPWYFAGKYENSDDFGDIVNAFAQRQHKDWTFKAGIGIGDQFSGDTHHFGMDYKVSSKLKVFAEYYSEEKNYALLRENAASAGDYFGAGGFGARQNGKALLTGFRFDFSTDQ